MSGRVKHGLHLVLERLARWCVIPAWRARILKTFGATIGCNVRICECQFINLRHGFANLVVGDDVYIGPGCLIDLEERVVLGTGATLSPRVIVITHNDPGSYHRSPLVRDFPPSAAPVIIGAHCWIGTNAVLLAGAEIGDLAVIGAMSLVKGRLAGGEVHAGIPARRIRAVTHRAGEE